MFVHRIPKRAGGYRTLYVPSRLEKRRLRALLPWLHKLVQHTCPSCVHGFIPGRSPLTNAAAHVGYAYTLCCDLQDFFDRVSLWHVERVLPQHVLEQVLVDGAPRQGLPTSPCVANLAAAPLDAAILAELPADCCYTRYADDLSLSFHSHKDHRSLKSWLYDLVRRHRFVVQERKTRLQCDGMGRVITGVVVQGQQLRVTRRLRRKLRAAHHQGNAGSWQGLQAWQNHVQGGSFARRLRAIQL